MGDVDKFIRGAGGKGGAAKGGGAVEADNTLRSRQWAQIIDVLGEGEIEGLVGLHAAGTVEQKQQAAEQSIYLDGVPLRNEIGTPNFDLSGISWAFVPGTQDQAMLPMGGVVAAEVQVGQQVKAGNTGGGPVVRHVAENYLDAVRITLMVPRLTTQSTTNGNLDGGKVEFSVETQSNNAGFIEAMRGSIEGKTNSEYQRSYEIPLLGPGPWDIKVIRLTPDSDNSSVTNDLHWSSYSKITKEKLRYPNTAMVGLKVDSALFNHVPARAYKCRLLKVRIPSGYDPIARTYPTFWDGTWDYAWTDNPAWCWYDLVTNERYGLGNYLDVSTIDKWALYSIAQYCDELVSDGSGGTEPRFRCNLILQTREEAIKVILNMASIFRGIVYWHTNAIFCSQDRPNDPVKLFTPSNVIDGVFTYSGTARQARHTVAMVSWNDPENMYKQEVEYVEDRESILRLGVREIEVTAMGCTSRSQAHRLGKWTLLTEREETDTVSFRTGLEGCGVMPGEIIQTTDPARAGDRMGGRILSSTPTTLTLDAPVTLKPGLTYSIAVVLPSGVIQERDVVWSGIVDTELSTLDLVTALDALPQDMAVWILSASSLVPELWRVMSTTEVEDGVVEITALEHVPGKYAAVEQNIKLEPRPVSNINLKPDAVTNLTAFTDVKRLNDFQYSTRVLVSWSPVSAAARYVVSYRRGSENPKTQVSSVTSADLDDVAAGTFEITVYAENALGVAGPSTTITHVVDEAFIEGDITNLRLNKDFLGKDCPIIWDRIEWAIAYVVRIYSEGTLLREETIKENSYTYTFGANSADGGPHRYLDFAVKALSWRGRSGNWVELSVSNAAPAAPLGVNLDTGPGQIAVTAGMPNEQDLKGMIVWYGTAPFAAGINGTKVYEGTSNHFLHTGLVPGTNYFYRVAFYDEFGKSGLNESSLVYASPANAGGIRQVQVLPAHPSDINNEMAVFLDVPDENIRGLYGWDGTQWRYTRDGGYLVANSVTADKMYVNQLSSISANMGSLTSGNITLASNGWIRGGALDYSVGNGVFLGYDSSNSKYKFRAGYQNGAGIFWDGDSLTIRGSHGNKLLTTGEGHFLNVGLGVNQVFNGNYIDSLIGTLTGNRTDNGTTELGRNLPGFTIPGEGVAYIHQSGTVSNSVVFEAEIWAGASSTSYFTVMPGRRYEAYAWMRSSNAKASIGIRFFALDGSKIADVLGPPVTFPATITNMPDVGTWSTADPTDYFVDAEYLDVGYFEGDTNSGTVGNTTTEIVTNINAQPSVGGVTSITKLGDLVQHLMFATAPPTAVKALVFVRASMADVVDPFDPYVFFTRVYFGEAGPYQLDASPWTPGRGLTQINRSNVDTAIADKTIYTRQIESIKASTGFMTVDTQQFTLDEQGNATFAGNLVAATGTFAGTLAAGVVNASSFEAVVLPAFTTAGTFNTTVQSHPEWSAVAMRIKLVGAGGGGGGATHGYGSRSDWVNFGGGGGAGHSVTVQDVIVTPGASLTIVVGAGGVGGSGQINAPGFHGNAGGQSSVLYGVNTQWIAAGGGGGGGGLRDVVYAPTYYPDIPNIYSYIQVEFGGDIGGQKTLRPTGNSIVDPMTELSYPEYIYRPGKGGSSKYGTGGTGGNDNYDRGLHVNGYNGGTSAGGGGGGCGTTGWRGRFDDNIGSGGRGGDGYVLIEFYDPNTVVRNSRYSRLVEWLEGFRTSSSYATPIPSEAL